MPTGAEFARVPNKRLLSAEDIQDRILGYLRALNVATVKAQWDVDGVFNTKLTLTGDVDSVVVNGTSWATDGLGHILDVAAIFSATSLFENTNAIVYNVAFKYAESPSGIIINPRTGLPEYIATEELIGESAAPTSVTDNGNGTITFNVNSVTEAGVSNAGRTVRVFKVIPDPDALTAGIAIEDRVVAFGANNTITTAGSLGQSVISTTAADYVVVLLGASVKRNLDTEATSGYFHIGTVTGVGVGNTPSVFDITDQRVLKSFDDASQTIFVPYLWIDSVNVQDAIEELVDGLLDDGSTDPGASRIGVDGTAFSSAELGGSAPRFGIGNVADTTLTDPVEVQETLEAVDVALRRRHTYVVVNDANAGSAPADLRNVVLDSAIGAYGNLFLRKLFDTAVPYQINVTIPSGDRGVRITGEFKDPEGATDYLKRTRIQMANDVVLSGGKWDRVYLDAASGNKFKAGGLTANGRYGLQLEDFGINGGTFYIDSIQDPTDGPIRLTNGTIFGKSEATKALASSLRIGGDTAGPVWAILSGLCIYGPNTNQTSPATLKGAINLSSNLAGSPTAATGAEQPKPLVIRDCVFVQQRTDTPLLVVESAHKVVYENCHFYGIIGYVGPDPLIKLNSNSVVVFRDCLFFDPEGHTIGATNTDGLFENCTIVSGVGGSATVTSPQIVKATPNTSYNQGLTFRNTTVIIGTAAIRSTGTPPSLLDFGSTSTTDINVEGLRVKFISGSSLPASPTLKLGGASGAGGKAIYEKIIIDCGGLALPSANTTGLVTTETGSAWQKNTFIKHISVFSMVNPTGDLASTIIALNGSIDVENINIRVPVGTAGRLNSYVTIGHGNVDVQGIHFDPSSTMRLIKAPIWINTDANANKGTITRVTRNYDNAWVFGGTDPAAGVILCDGERWDISKVRVDMESQGTIKMFVLSGTGNILRNSEFSSGSTSVPLVHCTSGYRRNRVMDNYISWNGSAAEAVLIEADSSLADNNIFLRTGGAQEPITNTGDGGVIGSHNILDDVA